jgi:hypothetical protein
MALFVRRTPPSPVVIPTSRDPLWAVHDLIRTPGGRNLLQDDVVERLADPDDDLGLEPKPGIGAETQEPKPCAASEDEDKNSSPTLLATLAAAIAFVIGLVVAVMAFDTDNSGPTYTAAEGIGAFALFYLAAQAAERLVELVLPHFEWVPRFGKASKEVARDKKVAAALDPTTPRAAVAPDTKTPEEEAAEAQAELDQLRANRTAVVFGVTAAIGMAACGYLEADFLTAVGVDFGMAPDMWEELFIMAVTGLVVGGGAKGLHDTITNISKSSDNKSTPQETGGQT